MNRIQNLPVTTVNQNHWIFSGFLNYVNPTEFEEKCS